MPSNVILIEFICLQIISPCNKDCNRTLSFYLDLGLSIWQQTSVIDVLRDWEALLHGFICFLLSSPLPLRSFSYPWNSL